MTAYSTRVNDPHKIVDPALLGQINERISNTMTKLFRQPANGGNPFLFALSVSKPHVIVDETVPGWEGFTTAATDGKVFYWNPKFLMSLSEEEVPTVMMHEGYHVLYFHCERMKGADPRIRNICMDWVVNSNIEKDHRDTGRKGQLWGGNLGEPVLFQDFLDYIDGKNEKFGISSSKKKKGSDKTDGSHGAQIFADMSVYGRSPESLYDEVMKHWQKSPRRCTECDSLTLDPKTGISKIPQPWKQPCCSKCGSPICPKSGKGTGDGLPMPIDSHIDSKMSKHEVQSEVMRAAQQAQMMRGTVPSGVEDMLGELLKPTLKFTDIIRSACMRKVNQTGMQNDWKRFRRRWLRANPRQYLPKRHTHQPRWLAMIDTSGSMSQDDLIYGLSQLKALDKSGTEGYVVSCDAQVHWDSLTKVEKADDVAKTKIVGRGGTVFDDFFAEFPEKVGMEWDCVVIITDGDCGNIPMNLRPPLDVVWVLTRYKKDWKPSFGRVAPLRNEKM